MKKLKISKFFIFAIGVSVVLFMDGIYQHTRERGCAQEANVYKCERVDVYVSKRAVEAMSALELPVKVKGSLKELAGLE